MLFNSLPFLIFLPALLILFYLIPHRWRWLLLFFASYFFYGSWKVEYLTLIIASTTVDYFAAQGIYNAKTKNTKKAWLGLSLISNLSLLIAFKYAAWLVNDFGALFLPTEALMNFDKFWDFALPVGISFYTFQTIGYSLDVYNGKIVPEKNYLKFGLFVSFFAQLVAGPIERFSSLHPQLFQNTSLQFKNLQKGARLILYGLFIKMCIADNLAPIVNQIFNDFESASQWQLLLGAIGFGFQIYSDFHGYSLVAIGSAQLFGITLMDNFNAPYTATSIRAFWSKWHISLSTWFRDYLYIPLGGNKKGNTRLYLNILIVFIVSGIWHGANLTFLIWGAIHGTAYLLEKRFTSNNTKGWLLFPKWFVTMSIVFTAWIWFRSPDVSTASAYFLKLTTGAGEGLALNIDPIFYSLFGLFLISDLHCRNKGFDNWIGEKSTLFRWLSYGFLFYSILTLSGTVQHPFIYFQF